MKNYIRMATMIFKACTFLYLMMFSTACCSLSVAEDIPTPLAQQLILEPHLVQIVLNDEHRQGVDWEAIVGDFHPLSLKKDDDPNIAKLSIGTISNEDYAVLLDALDAVGQVTQSSLETVTIATETPTKVQFPTADSKAALSVDVALDTKNIAEKHVQIIPHFMGKSAATSVEIKSNTTLVLGSIFSEHEVTKTKKFPLLGDIPIVGLVFRSKGKLMQKIETIIFLSSKG